MTTIASGSALANKVFSVGLFTVQNRARNELRNLSGPLPKQAATERKIKLQSDAGMPVVTASDLSRTAGDTISIDLVNIIGGKPIMGDADAEGKGVPLTFSSMDVKINQTRKPIKAGGRMTQKRTKHQLRTLALTNGSSYMERLRTQLMWVHLAGARGSQGTGGLEWVVPAQTDADFAEICVNSVKAPTYNRHYVIDSTGFVQGGLQLGSIDSGDSWKLSHIDEIRRLLDNAEYTLQPVKIPDDPAAGDQPMWVLYLSPNCYNDIIRDATANNNIRAFQAAGLERRSYGSKHPLFSGEFGMWNGILVRKMSRAIRFAIGESTNIVTVANRYTATESAQAVNAGLAAGYAVERGLLLGAQALCEALGKNEESGGQFYFDERQYDFKSKLEVCVGMMGGMAKTRFSIPDSTGTAEPTDHGVFVFDAATKQ